MELLGNIKEQLRHSPSGKAVEFYERVELRAWTALRLGGVADLLIRGNSVEAISDVVNCLSQMEVPWLMLGAGSRLVVPDEGLRTPVVTLGGELTRWEVDLDGVQAGCGAKLTHLCRSMARTGLSGLEDWADELGSLGGAVVSAGRGTGEAPGRTIEWVDAVVAPDGDVVRVEGEALSGWALERDPLLFSAVRARLGLEGDDLAAIRARMEPKNGLRAARVTGGLGVAQAFRDPPGDTADRVLTEADCAGLRLGGARLQTGRPNQICTTRGARSRDVAALCDLMAQQVDERLGIALQRRLVFVDSLGRRQPR